MIRNHSGALGFVFFVLTTVFLVSPAAFADLIGADPDPSEAVTVEPVTPASGPTAAVPPPGPSLESLRGQMRTIGLSPEEIESRVAQLNESELAALCRDPQQLQVASGFQILGVEAGAAVIIFLAVAVIVGLWWWFGE